MTSSVMVTAHCGSKKKVEVRVNGELVAELANEESREVMVYDDREVSVKEVLTEPE